MALRQRIVLAFALFIFILMVGTFGYIVIEDYSPIDAVYMVAITITTVGYGEVRELSTLGRFFTIFLILVGFSSLGLVGSVIAEALIENIWSGKKRIRKMKSKISKLNDHYIICGFGRVGQAVADDFLRAQVEFVVIDADPLQFESEGTKDLLHLVGDATHENILLEAGIKRAHGVVALLNSDPTNLYIVLTSRELNPTLTIISRAEEHNSIKRIKQAGADHVISTFVSVGKQIANEVLSSKNGGSPANGVQPQADHSPEWVTVEEGSSMVGKKVADLSRQMKKEIMGLRRGEKDLIQPDQNTDIVAGDKIFVLSSTDELGHLSSQKAAISKKKIVIVDDNQVILRLYVRLFQKSGFHPVTALNGEDGVRLILEENPDVAVIDFMLPKMSGVEVCKKVRNQQKGKRTKLIVFTSDESSQTRQAALDAGADDVILKSPDAFKVIQTVTGSIG